MTNETMCEEQATSEALKLINSLEENNKWHQKIINDNNRQIEMLNVLIGAPKGD